METPALDPATRRALEANIQRFYLFRLLVHLQFWMPIWVIYLLDERGLSLQQVTFMDAPFFLALVLAEVPTGAIADRYGRRLSLALGTLCNAVAVLVFAMAHTFPLLLLSYVTWGVALTLYSGADAAFVYDSLRALGRTGDYAKVIGRGQAAVTVGTLAGTIIGAPLAGLTNLVFPIVISSVMLFAAFAVTLAMHEPPRRDASEEDAIGYLEGIRRAARVAWELPELRTLTALMALLLGAGGVLFIFTQPFLDRHGVAVGNLGWFIIPGQLLSIASALLVHRIATPAGIRRALALAPLCMIFATGVLGAFDTLWAFAVVPLNSAIYASLHPLTSNYTNARVGSGQRATVLSLQNLCVSVTAALVEPIGGVIAHAQGLQAAYAAFSVLLAVAGAPLLIAWLRADQRAPARRPSPSPLPASAD